MKINSSAVTNFNHINQNKPIKETTKIEIKKVEVSMLQQETSTLNISQKLISTNSEISKFQLLDTSLDKLEEFSNSLLKYLPKGEETKYFDEDNFDAIRENMLDIVDNTMFENEQLFTDLNIEGLSSVNDMIESLDSTSAGNIELFKNELQEFKNLAKNSVQFLEVSINNTMAAMNSSSDISKEALKEMENKVDVKYSSNIHIVQNFNDINSLVT